MHLMNVIAMFVWTGAGALLLFVLMWIDSLFTKYKDLAEIKNGNTAVATRFILKMFAQGYILSQSIAKSNDLWQALLVSVISFVILFILEKLVEWFLKKTAGLHLEEETHLGKVSAALFQVPYM